MLGEFGRAKARPRPITTTDVRPRQVNELSIPEASKQLASDLDVIINENGFRKILVDKNQDKIYSDYAEAMRDIVTEKFENLGADFADEQYKLLGKALEESYKRVTNSPTLKNEIELATKEELIKAGNAETQVSEEDLTRDISAAVTKNMAETFAVPTSISQLHFFDALDKVLSEEPHKHAIEKISKERLTLTQAFKQANERVTEARRIKQDQVNRMKATFTETTKTAKSNLDRAINEADQKYKVALNEAKSSQKNLSDIECRLKKAEEAFEQDVEESQEAFDQIRDLALRELSGLEKPITQVVGAALNTRLSTGNRLPFYIAPPRPIRTNIPPPLQNKQISDPSVQANYDRACTLAGLYGIKDAFIKSGGDAIAVPALSSVAVGCAASISTHPTTVAIAGGVTVLVNGARSVARDYVVAQLGIRSYLSGELRVNELLRHSSLAGQARKALATRYGSEWLNDFEDWGSRSDMLTLDNAMTIMLSVREKLNHFLILKSEHTDFYKKYKAIPEHVKNSIQSLSYEQRLVAKSISRFNIESKTIKEELINRAIPYDDLDELGIRCLSHLRDDSPTDDVKEFFKWIRSHPRIEESQVLIAEATTYLQETFKYSTPKPDWSDTHVVRLILKYLGEVVVPKPVHPASQNPQAAQPSRLPTGSEASGSGQ